MADLEAAYVLQEFLAAHFADNIVDPGTHRKVLEGTTFKEGTRQYCQTALLKDRCVFEYDSNGRIKVARSRASGDVLWRSN